MKIKPFAILALVAFAFPASALAQSAVFIVRHAERSDAGMVAPAGADPDLSPAGRARAALLATMLRDTRITQIFVTEFKRTHQTAEPLAKLLGLEPIVLTSKDTAALAGRLKAASGHVLVVGHSNSVPGVIKALGVVDAVTIGDSEFDNMFVVLPGANPLLLRLRYPGP